MHKLEKLLPKEFRLALLFRGSEDGFQAAAFHKNCDN
jgi:hypothetical protein